MNTLLLVLLGITFITACLIGIKWMQREAKIRKDIDLVIKGLEELQFQIQNIKTENSSFEEIEKVKTETGVGLATFLRTLKELRTGVGLGARM